MGGGLGGMGWDGMKGMGWENASRWLLTSTAFVLVDEGDDEEEEEDEEDGLWGFWGGFGGGWVRLGWVR